MRHTAIVAVAVTLAATVSFWGGVIAANLARQAVAAPTAPLTTISAMQMMHEAKDLPVQQYDAH